MTKTNRRILLSIFILNSVVACANPIKNTSDYSELSGTQCVHSLLEEVTGSSVDKCPGPNGYSLNVLYDDNRMSIDVVTPENKEIPLNYWEIISTGFSTISGNAEWRVKTTSHGVQPVALITQFEVTDNSNMNTPQKGSYYVISKINKNEICITNKVSLLMQDAYNKAVALADNAENQPCLQP